MDVGWQPHNLDNHDDEDDDGDNDDNDDDNYDGDENDNDDDDGLFHLAAHNLEAKQSRRRSGQRVLPGVDLINLNIKKGFVLQQSNRGLSNVSSVSHF